MAEEEKKYGVKNPSEGINGKLASNMTGEAIESNYDYGSITDNDKKVVTEIIDLMRNRGEVPCSMFAEELKIKFGLEEIPMKRIEDTVWGQLTKNERIGQSIQGFRMATDEKGKKTRIPHVGFSADLDYLDEFINRLVQRALEVKNK